MKLYTSIWYNICILVYAYREYTRNLRTNPVDPSSPPQKLTHAGTLTVDAYWIPRFCPPQWGLYSFRAQNQVERLSYVDNGISRGVTDLYPSRGGTHPVTGAIAVPHTQLAKPSFDQKLFGRSHSWCVLVFLMYFNIHTDSWQWQPVFNTFVKINTFGSKMRVRVHLNSDEQSDNCGATPHQVKNVHQYKHHHAACARRAFFLQDVRHFVHTSYTAVLVHAQERTVPHKTRPRNRKKRSSQPSHALKKNFTLCLGFELFTCTATETGVVVIRGVHGMTNKRQPWANIPRVHWYVLGKNVETGAVIL